jgi:hypothetical protein
MMLGLATGIALLIGLLLGMLGGGGSVLLVPVLLYVLKLEPKTALLTSQLVMAVTTTVAMTVHALAGRVIWRTGLVFGLAGMLGAYAGGRVAHYIPARLLLLGFTFLMVVSAIQMLRSRGQKAELPTKEAGGMQQLTGVLVGLPTGFLGGLLGAGGGFLVVPALTIFGGLPIAQAVGTSLLVIAMQSTAGAAGYLGHAHVDLAVVTSLAVAMGAGSIGGGLLSKRISAVSLRRFFAILLLAAAALMLVRNLW